MASAKETRRNREILAPEVRVIGLDGEQVGVMKTYQAIEMAEQDGYDLVEIAPNSVPPVVRVMDYGKFKFEQSKKAAAAKKRQKVTQVKEVKFRPGTEEADFQVKMRNVRRFIEEGDKVKITLRFRGREMAHQELGQAMLERIRGDMVEEAVVEQFPKMEGRQMVMLISPKRV